MIGDGAISAASSILAWVLAFVPLSPVVDVADTIGAVAGWLSPYTAGIDTILPAHEMVALLLAGFGLRVAGMGFQSAEWLYSKIPVLGH